MLDVMKNFRKKCTICIIPDG